MRFSITVPAYNVAAWLPRCVASVRAQTVAADAFELLIIDDHSRDETLAVAHALGAEDVRIRVLQTPANGGPGAARNEGLAAARGEWIVFLDADDQLQPQALAAIAARIDAEPDVDLVGYDWRFDDGSGGRNDWRSLSKSKADLIRDALALKTDGSVIFTAMRRAMLQTAGVTFAPGLHEDVDFIFEAYCAARAIAYIPDTLYEKTARDGSIVQTMSRRHIDGFMRALDAMGQMARGKYAETLGAPWSAFELAHAQGWVGVIATRVRAMRLLGMSAETAAPLLSHLAASVRARGIDIERVALPVRTTKYFALAQLLLSVAEETPPISADAAAKIFAFVDALPSQSFSCTDLHHSVFLRSEQVRTCCKRFFVEGEMRGDIVLMDARGGTANFGADAILSAKRDLHAKINRGEASGCEGCTFLELKKWDALDHLKVKYLSLEHHSVCNLKCTYCSEDYYGGARAKYDVPDLVDQLIDASALDACEGIVWGGGEPTIDAHFEPIVRKLEAHAPHVKQRILTNAVAKNSTVEELVARDRATIVTSVDAGTAATFEAVRGKDRLRRVMENLRAMSVARPQNVTVKYIFTDGNADVSEALAFAELASEYDLLGCNFQLSSDFKKETVPFEALTAMAALYGALEYKNCRLVFVDDLVRQRFYALRDEARVELAQSLRGLGLGDAIADAAAYDRVAIWGAGWQAKFLLERARFFDTVEAHFFVDATPSKIGRQYLDRDVRAPEALIDDGVPVVIAAAQGYPAIYQSYIDLGLDPKRLVRGLIL